MNYIWFIPLIFMMVFFSGNSINILAQDESAEPQELPIIIYAEIIIRNPDGTLVTYLEHYFFRVNDPEQFNQFLDEAMKIANVRLVEFLDVTYETIKVHDVQVWRFEQVRTIDSLIVEVSGKPVNFVDFDHEAYLLLKGDERTMIWTILRPLQ